VRLSVFAGGWTLEGAEDVASAILDQPESLVTKSLVRFDGRFSTLETIRAYTAARLAEQGKRPGGGGSSDARSAPPFKYQGSSWKMNPSVFPVEFSKITCPRAFRYWPVPPVIAPVV
jgi:hypothetical protein